MGENMLYVRRTRLFSLLLIMAALSTSCLKGSDQGSDSTTLPSTASCGTPYDVTLNSRDYFQWPFFKTDFEKNNSFWMWYIDKRLHGSLGATVYFDHLDKNALSAIQLNHETLKADAIVFNIEDVNYKTVHISMNGLKGMPLSHDAIEVKTIQTYTFKKHIQINDSDICDKDNRDKNKCDKDKKYTLSSFKLVEITFHLEKFIFGVNKTAAALIRDTALHNGSLSFKFTHHAGVFRGFESTLRLEGEYPGHCPSPTPSATATPEPTGTPTPTPTPTGTPEPSPSPKPAPIASIDSISVGTLTNSRSIQITFSADQPAQFQCSLDSSNFTACTTPYSANGLSDGQHHFAVEANNANGTSQPAQFDWTVDATTPTLNFTAITPSGAQTSQTQITFEFSSSEPASFECRLDNSAWSTCNSPMSYNNLTDGDHSFDVQGKDLAGNMSAALSHGWNVKTVAPGVTITQIVPVENPSKSTSRSFYFEGTTDAARFTCSLDGSAEAGCNSPYGITSLADGGHQVAIYAYDAVSNRSTPAISAFTIDTIVPDVTITSTIPGQQLTNQNAMQIIFASNESASFTCSFDGSAMASCASPMNYGSLSEGSHEFNVTATDTAGNTSIAMATYRWTTDYTAPIATITSTNPSSGVFNQTEIALNFSLNENASALCALDGNTAIDCASGSVSYLGLSEGNHSIAITATDIAGNTANPVTYNFTVDTTQPTVQISAVNPDATLTNQTGITFSFLSLDNSAGFQCQLDSGAYATCTSPHSYTGLADGNHTFNVRAVDQAGNVSASPANHAWSVDTTAPSTQITGISPPEDPTTSDTISFTLSSNEMGTFECQLDGAGYSTCTSPVTYNGLAASTHTFNARAIDQAGNIDNTGVSRTWTITANQLPAPVISNKRATGINSTSELIRWDTDIPSTSQVSYSTVSASGPFTDTSLDSSLVTAHSVTLTGLTPNTFYFVRVRSKNSSGLESTSDFTFRSLR
jgi:hypothetical protein